MSVVDLLTRFVLGKEVLEIVSENRPDLKQHVSGLWKGLENFLQFIIGSWFLFLFLGGLIMWLLTAAWSISPAEILLVLAFPLVLAAWFFDLSRR